MCVCTPANLQARSSALAQPAAAPRASTCTCEGNWTWNPPLTLPYLTRFGVARSSNSGANVHKRLRSEAGNEEERSVLCSDWPLNDPCILDKPACVTGTPLVLAAFGQQRPLLVAEGRPSTPRTCCETLLSVCGADSAPFPPRSAEPAAAVTSTGGNGSLSCRFRS